MRDQTKEFTERFLKEHNRQFYKVLEVGSRCIENQPTIREVFKGAEYTGLDMNKGVNVDLVLNAHDIKSHFKENTFDLVVCFDTLEHDEKFWVTVENMRWVLSKGGYMIIGVPGRNMGNHEYPSDYWRFMANGVKEMFKDYEDCYLEIQTDDEAHIWEDEIYAWGRKP